MKKGSALAWAEQKLDEYSTGNPTAQPAIAPWAITWADFLVELRAAFGDVAREKLARICIYDIKQTKMVDAYNVAFNTEQAHTGFNEEALLDIWKKGLKPSILRRIYNEATAPANFAAWRTRASHYDHVDQELSAAFPPKDQSSSSSKHKSRHIGASFFPKPTTSSTKASTSTSASTSSAPVKIKQERVEASVFAAQVARGVCGVCESKDHYANACPQRLGNNHRGERFGRGRGGSKHGKKSDHTINNVEKDDPKQQSASGSI
jgi:hypothetical protein